MLMKRPVQAVEQKQKTSNMIPPVKKSDRTGSGELSATPPPIINLVDDEEVQPLPTPVTHPLPTLLVPTPSVKPVTVAPTSNAKLSNATLSSAKPATATALALGECPPDYHDLYDDWQDDNSKKMASPNVLRGQIRKFLASTGCKITAFQKIIGVNGNSYNKFMNGKYKDQWSATANSTYSSAAYFFWREKKMGKNKSIGALWSSAQPARPALPNVSSVVLESSEIYLTPQEVRKELSNLSGTYACTQADIAKAAGAPNANAMSRFMSAGGEFGGQDQDFYSMAARYVEKLRVQLGKPKSKKRKALEQEQQPGKRPFLGVDTSQKVWCFAGSEPCKGKDDLGRTVFNFR